MKFLLQHFIYERESTFSCSCKTAFFSFFQFFWYCMCFDKLLILFGILPHNNALVISQTPNSETVINCLWLMLRSSSESL